MCAFTEEFATKNPKIGEGGAQGAAPGERASRQARESLRRRRRSSARPTYINCPPEIILQRLLGNYDYGDGRKEQDKFYMIFSDRDCNYPHPAFGKWWLSQFRRWGMVEGRARLRGHRQASVMRPDIYVEAMKELGVHARRSQRRRRGALRRLTFDPKSPEAYATGFSVNSVKV